MAMSKNDINIVESLIRGGASSAEIMSEIEKIEARIKVEEEAKKKTANAEKEKIAKRDAARTKLIEASIQYALDCGWVEKKDIQELDIQELEKAFLAEEKVIDNMKEFNKFFKRGTGGFNKFFKGTPASSDILDPTLEPLLDALFGDTKKECKCDKKDKKVDCSESKSLIDQIDELLRQ
jgi:hypothetical protein